jgi:hypothetical protein
MAQLVCNNASLQCSFGVAPSQLIVLPKSMVMTNNQPAANIMDYLPMANIMPFGMCITPSNPQVAAATAAAFGVLTPMPCIPVTTAPWVPGSLTVMIGKQPAVNNSCQLLCAWGGIITVVSPGQVTVMVP